jgi:hypothetical protein
VGTSGFRKICAKEKRNESEEQPQSRTVIRRHSRLRDGFAFSSRDRTQEKFDERRTPMKVQSGLKAGQSSVAVLD